MLFPQFLAIMNKAAMKLHVQFFVWTYKHFPIPKKNENIRPYIYVYISEVVGSYSNSMFNFLRNCQIVF